MTDNNQPDALATTKPVEEEGGQMTLNSANASSIR
jgi:hypothetical protein